MDIVIFGLYMCLVLGCGMWAGKGIKDMDDFSVAGRNFSRWVIFATLSASFIGGGFSLGNAEKVFQFGLMNIVALWGFSLKEILVAKFIAVRMDNFSSAISVGDIMGRVYGKVAQIITGVFSVILCAGILGAQVGGIGYIVEVFLGVPQIWGIIIGIGIVILYSAFGGMKSVIMTDIIQFAVLSVGIPLTVFFGIKYVGGVSDLLTAIPKEKFYLFTDTKSFIVLLSLFLSFLLGETLVPPYVQRLLISNKKEELYKGTLFSGLFSIPFFALTGFIGFIAFAINPEINPNLAMPFVIKTALPIGVKSLVIAAVVSIVMSSADSFLNASAVAFVHDVVAPIKKGLCAKRELFWGRITTVLTGIIAVIFAIKIKSVLDILLYSYNFWAPVILIPLIYALLGVKPSFKSFLYSALSGIAGVFCWKVILKTPLGIDGLVIGVFCNFIVFYLHYTLFDKKTA